MAIAESIFSWAEKNVKSLSAVHLRGTMNTVADYLSRHRVSQEEWSLDFTAFRQITDLWGWLEVDLFATKVNAKLQSFYSLTPEDRPLAIDALQAKWRFRLGYASPPLK